MEIVDPKRDQSVGSGRGARRIEAAIRRIQASPQITPKNKELLSRWPTKGTAIGQGPKRVEKSLSNFCTVAGMADFDFETATKEDLERLVTKIKLSDYRPWTQHDFLLALKTIYRHLIGDGETCPKVARWIKVVVDTRGFDTERIKGTLTAEEIDRMVAAATEPRMKAFIRFLYESGARIGEVLAMRMADVKPDGELLDVTLSGKTGPRVISVYASAPLLVQLIENHPYRNDPVAPLWYSIWGNGPKAISHSALWHKLEQIAKGAGIKKPVNPHAFRHARATHLSAHMTNAELCQYFGWRQGSDMPATYIHRTPDMLKGAVLRIHGLKPMDPKQIGTPVACDRCGYQNDPAARFCAKCALPFTHAERDAQRAKKEVGELLIEKLLKVPLDQPITLRDLFEQNAAEVRGLMQKHGAPG